MKLVRFGPPGQEQPGLVVDDSNFVDISGVFPDIGPDTIGRIGEIADLDTTGLPLIPLDSVRLGSPVSRPYKVIGVGQNYADHAAESGVKLPSEPVIFMKASSSMCGPDDDILIHPGFEKVDWEVELGLVIGKTARFLADEQAAADVIAGYFIGNDVSDRGFQLEREGQWVKGKSADTFMPLGPWLVTPDEIADVLDLPLLCSVNGDLRQNGNTAEMIFKPNHIIWYVSQCMTLEPGDVVLTGTPSGVGLSTGEYLAPGDVMELEIPGLGRQRQVCRAI